jgi:drug/metabolite transporter (DMT)-like permease
LKRPTLVWIVLGLIWGSTWLFIKLGLKDLPPFTFAGIRFLVASIPLLVLLLVRKRPMPRRAKDWGIMFATGIATFSVCYGLVFWGENHIPVGLTSVLYTTQPLFGLVFAHVLLRDEPLTLRRLGGVLLGIGGVVLLFSQELSAKDPLALWGMCAILLSAVAAAAAAVVIKRWGGGIDPVWLTTVQMLCGFVPLLVLGVALEGSPFRLHWTPMAWAALFYLGFVGSALPFVLYYWLLQRMDSTKVQLIALVCTIVAVLLGGIVLYEALSWRTVLGAIGVLVGLAVTTWPVRRAARPPSTQEPAAL